MSTPKKPAAATSRTTTTAAPAPAPAKKKKTSHTAASNAAAAANRDALAGDNVPAAVFTGLAVGITPLTTAQIGFFNSQIPDTLALEIGRSTRSGNVISLAALWGPIVRAALDAFATVLASVGYSPVRFAYFLALTSALQTAAAAQTTTASSKKTAVAATSAQHVAADAVLTQLVAKMVAFVGHSGTDETALSLLKKLTATDIELASTLQTHANLAATWLERTDAASVFFVSSALLSNADVTAANQAAAQLVTAAAAPALAAKSTDRDSPATNLAEGRALAEMRVMYKAFGAAQKLNKSIPTLTLVRGTKSVFSHKANKLTTTGTGDATIVTPAPTGGTPPTGSAA